MAGSGGREAEAQEEGCQRQEAGGRQERWAWLLQLGSHGASPQAPPSSLPYAQDRFPSPNGSSWGDSVTLLCRTPTAQNQRGAADPPDQLCPRPRGHDGAPSLSPGPPPNSGQVATPWDTAKPDITGTDDPPPPTLSASPHLPEHRGRRTGAGGTDGLTASWADAEGPRHVSPPLGASVSPSAQWGE